MQRVLFTFGFSYMAVQLCAAFLPRALLLPAAIFIAAILLLLKRFGKQGRATVVIIAAMASVLLFTGRIFWQVRPLEQLAGRTYRLEAYVDDVQTGYRDGTVQACLSVISLNGQKTNFRVICDALPDSEPGEIVNGLFSLHRVPKDDFWSSRYANHIYLLAEPTGAVRWKIGEPRLIDRLRKLRMQLSRNISKTVPGPYDAVVAAMSIGDKSGLTQQYRELFRTAGLSHLLVVSGLHLTLLCGIFLREDRFHGLFRRVRGVLSLLMVLFLMGITGFTPSVCRAGIMVIVYDIGQIFLLPADGLTSLGFSAIILCTLNPYAACDVGLQLSYSATLGVLFVGELLRRRENVLPEQRTLKDKVYIFLLKVAAPPFFAAVYTLPVQVWHGMTVSGVSLLANLLSLWSISPLLLCGMASALLGYIPQLEVLQRLFALTAAILCRALMSIAAWCGSLPFARLMLPKGYTIFVWGLLLLFAILLWKGKKFHWIWAAAPCFVLTAALCAHTLQHRVVTLTLAGNSRHPSAIIAQDGRSLVLFRGGQGDAAAVQYCLKQQGMDEAALLVDLRQEPKSKNPACAAQQYLRLEDLQDYGTARHQFGHMNLSVLNQPNGNLAVLQIEGYRIAVATGRIQLQNCPVDLFLAGETLPKGIDPESVLMTSTNYEWIKALPSAELYYSAGQPIVQIRPGKSCRFFEVSNVTHTAGS